MHGTPPAHFSPDWEGADRPPLPRIGSERELLTSYLDWHRATLAAKCAGLTSEQLSARSVEPSSMSLHGLVRHLAGVERWWLRIRFAGEDLPLLYYSDEDPDQDFGDVTGDPNEALAVWREETAHAREITAAFPLDAIGGSTRGAPVQLRTVLVRLVAEYARHNGHADLLRERIDGSTGH
ncbi:DinB family protein [Nocardiopsis halotolerans]|uniref:DinB family protein n=1 Tax=Nocardiopsis halotolerans TaxID=124252 RepID=UPI00034BACA1|nr:DinB family protein [Nocardiopsis halotolerans]